MALPEAVHAVAAEFLGSNADGFIERQCRAHLRIEPSALTRGHLPELAKWVGISAAIVLPRDKAVAFKMRILGLEGSA